MYSLAIYYFLCTDCEEYYQDEQVNGQMPCACPKCGELNNAYAYEDEYVYVRIG